MADFKTNREPLRKTLKPTPDLAALCPACISPKQGSYQVSNGNEEVVDFLDDISECDKGQALQGEWYSENHGFFCERPKQEVTQGETPIKMTLSPGQKTTSDHLLNRLS